MKWEELTEQQKIDAILDGQKRNLGCRGIGKELGISYGRISQFKSKYPNVFPSNRGNKSGIPGYTNIQQVKKSNGNNQFEKAIDVFEDLTPNKAGAIILREMFNVFKKYEQIIEENKQLKQENQILKNRYTSDEVKLAKHKEVLDDMRTIRRKIAENTNPEK